jgi:hypothetical protein
VKLEADYESQAGVMVHLPTQRRRNFYYQRQSDHELCSAEYRAALQSSRFEESLERLKDVRDI